MKNPLLYRIEACLSRPFQRIYGHNVQKRFGGSRTVVSEALVAASNWVLDVLSYIYSTRMVGRR